MVPAVVLGTVITHVLIALCLLLSRWGYARARTSGPRFPAVGADDLDPADLGMLAGGRTRMGEVALAGLYLSGRVIARGNGAVSAPEQPPCGAPPLPRPPSPFGRLMEASLEPGRCLPAERLIESVTLGDAATAVLWRLRRLGLFFDPARLRRVRRLRRAAWAAHAAAGTGAAVLGAVLLLAGMRPGDSPVHPAAPAVFALLLMAYPFLLHVARRLLGGLPGAVACGAAAAAVALVAAPLPQAAFAAPLLYACWFGVHWVYRATGGRLGPRTLAGDALLAEARAAGPGPGAVGALRTTALVGFPELRRREGERGAAPGGAREEALVRSFAAACGRGLGRADTGLGGDFAGDGGSGTWRGDGDAPQVERHRRW
ncbi:TIGR04222 domain-containing membrane protein [Nocardiopsis baichengensis]|uniref:TIGR04222 domain-containing membrane protein n=1 Tax=Nocardiopsis baichengensis TaxID=280240 RepID=UPI0003461AD5|nr:TIGR04222 domain-containing membrane protein [Nocardiopsis baichengensis]